MGAVPDFRDLMSLVGHLLLRWGALEDGLGGAVIPNELERIRQMRNALCHRMVSARADPEGEKAAYVSCRLLNGTVVRYSAAELEEAIRELERIGHRYRVQ